MVQLNIQSQLAQGNETIYGIVRGNVLGLLIRVGPNNALIGAELINGVPLHLRINNNVVQYSDVNGVWVNTNI